MARRVDEFEQPAVEIEHETVVRFDHPRRVNRQDVAVHVGHRLFAIDGGGAGDQFRRVDHVACAARVHHQFGVREGAHHGARPARVIQVHVRQDDVAQRFRRDALLRQRRLHVTQRMAGAAIDQCRLIARTDEVDGRHAVADQVGVDGRNVVVVVDHAARSG